MRRSGDWGRLFVREWHATVEPQAVVCLIHGLGEHSGRYDNLASALTQGGFTVVAFDLRGHGKSPGRRGHISSYEVFLSDIDQILQQITGRFRGKPLFLYGHSMGGNLAINYALRRRPRLAGVVATCPWLTLAVQPPALKIGLAQIMNKLWPGFSQSNGLSSQDLSHDIGIARAYDDDPLVHDRISARLFTVTYEAGLWALEHAGDFSLPLLIMHGTGDHITSFESSCRFAEKVPGDCTLRLWDGMYHELHNEIGRGKVIEFLMTWLKARTPRG